jgi:predicted DNA-binding protein (MmcQ/YjbR family)
MNIDKLREICMKKKGATEGMKWDNHLCFMLCEKIFCITSIEEGCSVAMKVDPLQFDELTEKPFVSQAAHFSKRQWIAITRWNALSDDEWRECLYHSYELVKQKLPKTKQKAIDELP